MAEGTQELTRAFDCPSCGHAITPAAPVGERGSQTAACPRCGAPFTRTFAWFDGEWVTGLWRNAETGKVACSYYKTAFGTNADDC